MEVGRCAQQAADLHLILLDRPAHPELFRIWRSFRVRQGEYQAEVWITGLGHLVTVASRGRFATEIVGRDTGVLPARGVVSRFRLKGERDFEKELFEGWKYMVSSQVEVMDEGLYKSVHLDLLRHGAKRGVLVTYDEWAEGELVPFSLVDHEARHCEFHIHAFHAFPAERTVVKTQSLFEVPA